MRRQDSHNLGIFGVIETNIYGYVRNMKYYPFRKVCEGAFNKVTANTRINKSSMDVHIHNHA